MIVYSYYCLDIIHMGHIMFMENARSIAGKNGLLIAGILTDEAVMEKKSKPVIPFSERILIAKAFKFLDIVVPQETYSPLSNVKKMQPDILIESASHGDATIIKAQEVMSFIGGKVFVLPYFPIQSSTEIKEKIKNE